MKITYQVLRACAVDMGLTINFANKREVGLFKDTVLFTSRRRAADQKREFWDALLRKRGCNARSIWNCASRSRGRRVVKLARAISETKDPNALYLYSNKLRSQKFYELANMSHDYATRMIRNQTTKRA